MFEAFRGKFQSVQQDVTFGLKKLKHRSPSLQKFVSVAGTSAQSPPGTSGLSTSVSSPFLSSSYCNVDTNAGAAILSRNQEMWEATRETTERNVKAADQCSHQLNRLHTLARNKAAGFLLVHREAAALPAITEQMADLVTVTASLQEVCIEIEKSLAYLEVLADTQEFQEKKLDAKFNLALYREQKVAELSEAKAEMMIECASVMEEREKRKTELKKEKQALYQEAFEHDLQLYKNTGLISNSLPPLSTGLSTSAQLSYRNTNRILRPLKDLNGRMLRANASEDPSTEPDFDQDILLPDDIKQLEDFLSDIKLEDSGIAGSDCQSLNGDSSDTNQNDTLKV